MNNGNQNIIYSPIFDYVSLNQAPVLNKADIVYFQKQTIKHIMTHNMLKYHYKDIDN